MLLKEDEGSPHHEGDRYFGFMIKNQGVISHDVGNSLELMGEADLTLHLSGYW